MAPQKILTYPDPRLKQEAEPVERFDEALRELVRDLEQTMRAGPAAVGIAAPQVGRLLRVALVDVTAREAGSLSRSAGRARAPDSARKIEEHHGRMVLVNPEIVTWDGLAVGREGCLSVPGYTGNVIRAEQVELRAYDEQGVEQRHALRGFEARVAQHELDHLDGLLFLDRLVSRRSDLFRRKGNRRG